jgi:hypothetical protein
VKVPSEVGSLVQSSFIHYVFYCFLKVLIVLFFVMISYDENLISRGWQYSDPDLAIKTV